MTCCPKMLGCFSKQSSEVLDYDVDFTEWFGNRLDTPESYEVEAEDGITIEYSELSGNIVKVILSGGEDFETYKITVKLTTTATLVKEADFTVSIKDV